MDIPALSMALSQNKILNDVGVAVLAKSLDTMEMCIRDRLWRALEKR